MKTKIKDPKKVAAGRKGGKLSGNNFKRNKEGARLAGKKSAWARGERLLADFPLGLMDKAETIVAHNIEYDLDLLNIEIDYDREHGENQYIPEGWAEILQSKQQFCTMLNSRDLMKLPLSEAQASFFKDKGITQQYKNPRLQEAHIHFMGYDFDGAHDAMADVRACAAVYFKLHSLKEEVAA